MQRDKRYDIYKHETWPNIYTIVKERHRGKTIFIRVPVYDPLRHHCILKFATVVLIHLNIYCVAT